jgi:hypothetical protein
MGQRVAVGADDCDDEVSGGRDTGGNDGVLCSAGRCPTIMQKASHHESSRKVHPPPDVAGGPVQDHQHLVAPRTSDSRGPTVHALAVAVLHFKVV